MERAGFYDHPDWYDALHSDDTAEWTAFLERLHAAHGNGGRDWLEPACGTGRFLHALRERGWRVTGYDSDAGMVRYARRRLRGSSERPGRAIGSEGERDRGLGAAEVLRADMREFCRPGAFDLAFNVLGSFRHLLSERAASRHLALIARSLRPGGLYVLGLDLVAYDDPDPCEDDWRARLGRTTIDQLMLTLPPERRRRRERVIQFLTVRAPGKEPRRLQAEYDLRSYDRRELLALFRRAPFELAAAYSPRRALIPLDDAIRDVTLVWRRR